MKISLAKESDYEELMRLYNIFIGEDRYSRHDGDSFHRVLKNPNNFILVASNGQKMAGFATFSVRDVVRYTKPIAELDELFVLEEFRKQGTGKMLLEEVEKKAKELGCYRLFIESHYKHEVAHKFYVNRGYTNYGYHFIKNL